MEAGLNYFPFHIGDYAVHTRHLSLLEDLAYRRLIDLYYTRECALPADVATTARLVGMRDNVAEVEAVLREFFVQEESGDWVHLRCEEEITRFKAMAEGGKRGAAKRWAKGGDSPPIDPPMLTKNQEPRTKVNTAPTVLVERKASDAYRVPDCPYQAIQDAYAESLPSLPQITVLNASRRGQISGRWREVCAAEKFDAGKGIEFFRWFFGHTANSAFLTGNGSPGKSGRVWKADFDWLMKPTNFARVIEGRYHGKAAA